MANTCGGVSSFQFRFHGFIIAEEDGGNDGVLLSI